MQEDSVSQDKLNILAYDACVLFAYPVLECLCRRLDRSHTIHHDITRYTVLWPYVSHHPEHCHEIMCCLGNRVSHADKACDRYSRV
jgi:hypothetical protein